MDSTLIRTEVIDELADRAGVGKEVREITERAMRGEIDFNESFKERVALLKGLDVNVMEDIAVNLPITEGVDRMMTILKRVAIRLQSFRVVSPTLVTTSSDASASTMYMPMSWRSRMASLRVAIRARLSTVHARQSC